jgi:hypothetical protein
LFSQILGTALIAPTAVADRGYGRELPRDAVFGSRPSAPLGSASYLFSMGYNGRYSSPTTEKTTLQVDVSRIAQKFAERSDAKTVARTASRVLTTV